MFGCMFGWRYQTCLIHATVHPTGCNTVKLTVYTGWSVLHHIVIPVVTPVLTPINQCIHRFSGSFIKSTSMAKSDTAAQQHWFQQPVSRTTWVRWYQNVKPPWILLTVRNDGGDRYGKLLLNHYHQHTNSPTLRFLIGLPAACPCHSTESKES